MQRFSVSGMSCTACSARVEKAVSGLYGVEECSVNLLTNSMEVRGSASDEEIILAVKKAGYGASVLSQEAIYSSKEEGGAKKKADEGIKRMRSRFFVSFAFLLVLMYASMGHMWGLPLPKIIADSSLIQGAIQLVLTLVIAIINRHFFIRGTKAIIRLSPNMDTLVSLGSGASFIYLIKARTIPSNTCFIYIYTHTHTHTHPSWKFAAPLSCPAGGQGQGASTRGCTGPSLPRPPHSHQVSSA